MPTTAALADFKIETGVSIPNNKKRNGVTEALRTLARAPSGSSMFFPGTTVSRLAVRANCCELGGLKKAGLTARTVDGGARAWKL